MSFTFRRSFPVIPGILKYNVNMHSRSWTLKLGPLSRTWSSTGRVTTSANLPGPVDWRSSRRRNRS
jgi:hypothetical protein